MNSRTRSYLRGRFRDYYRRCQPRETVAPDAPILPPQATSREWAYIPFTSGSRSVMIRHQTLVEGDSLGEFLTREQPRHVYHSTAYYDEPGADVMGAKGWRGADLVFDLDADHLPGVDPDVDSYAAMLTACKQETLDLLGMLEHEFAFEDISIVFSGNRGYHVHIRDSGVDALTREARRELVEYIRGEGLVFDAFVSTETIHGRGGLAERRRLHTAGGWGQRVHQELLEYLTPLRDKPSDEVIERLGSFDGIGATRAASVARVVENRWDAVEAGEIDLHPDFVRFVRIFAEHKVAGSGPAIDEPVTTDIHRLIRLPGSLHGASGLVVQPVERGELETFDPLDDALAPTFTTAEITIDVREPTAVTLGGDAFDLPRGEVVVPEFVGIYLMARGRAEKVRE